MKLFTFLTFVSLILIPAAAAQRVVVLPFASDGWAYTRALDENNQETDPSVADSDFWQSWLDQSLGDYLSPLTYDGPAFTLDQQSPFQAGTVPGIQGGTSLDGPIGARWQRAYFLKVIDGGEQGYQNLKFRMLALDGAVVYLNGKVATASPNIVSPPFTSVVFREPGDGSSVIDLPEIPPLRVNGFLRPGPNLLAIAAGRVDGQFEDFGMMIEVTGEPGIPPITPISQTLIGRQLHLRWSTGEAQKTLVRIENRTLGTVEMAEGGSLLRNHHFIREFPPGAEIYYEVLRPNLESWGTADASGMVTIPEETIFAHQDSGWHFLQVRDPEGNDIDPTLSDPDFNETWFTHRPPGFENPPFAAPSYDGPAFAPASLPIQYGDGANFPEFATELAAPAGGEGHTLWLLKAIDGGADGFVNLNLKVRVAGGCFVYLNGERVAQTFGLPTDDTWLSHADGSGPFQARDFDLTSILNPGPNLLAVSVHHSTGKESALGFSAELKGSKGPLPEIRDVEESADGNSLRVTYLTGTPQPTLVELRTSREDRQVAQVPGDRVFHHYEWTDLDPGTTYFYEILRGDGTSFSTPVTGRVTTADFSYFEEGDNGWQVLHSLDSEGRGVNPALADPDFDTTWMTKGMARSNYDGPAFTPGQRAPIHAEGTATGIAGTILANPGEGRSGAVYLIREVEGPLAGASFLDFGITAARRHKLYLNGRLIIDTTRELGSAGSWDLYPQNFFPPQITKPGYLVPGKNIIAISLHPSDNSDFHLRFDMSLSGITRSYEMITLDDNTVGDSDFTVRWLTPSPQATRIRYGASRQAMTNVITLAGERRTHEVSLPFDPPARRLYYEILRADGSSYHPPAVHSEELPRPTLISFGEPWSFLDPRNPVTGSSIDPSLLDADFYETWLTQDFGSYSGTGNYDGPAFSPLLPAPFGVAGANPGTVVPGSEPVWFIKSIEGGTSGYHQLKLTGIWGTPVTVFLNGQKVAEANTPVGSQAIWAQPGGNFGFTSEISLPENLILSPGPNLMAVQRHRPATGTIARSFDFQLTGKALGETNIMPFALRTTATSANLSWATAQSQFSRLRWGGSLSSLMNSVVIPTAKIDHAYTLSGLTPATTYFVESLDASGQSFDPPVIASFRTADEVLVARQSSGWSILESIVDGAFVDPALSDPDFLTTWYDPVAYDGPAFATGPSAPFVTEGWHRRRRQTTLQTIEGRIRPVWLLKEIDGGENGYQSLTFDAVYNRAFAAYLNGELIASPNLEPNDPLGSWSLSSDVNAADDLLLSRKLPETVTLAPGSNTLAIALHPTRFDLNGRLTGEFELRGIPSRFTISAPTVTALDYRTFRLAWTTDSPTTTRVFLGNEAGALELVAEDSVPRSDHGLTLPAIDEGGTIFYEIAATDALGDTRVHTGFFPAYSKLMRRPFLLKAAPDSMTIKWRTREPGPTLIRYGENPFNLDRIFTGDSKASPFFTVPGRPDLGETITDHIATLTGLEPATRYYYQIAEDDSAAPAEDLERFFVTPPSTGSAVPTRIWVVGDSGQPGPGVKNVKDAYLQYVADRPADLWLMLGDNAYNSGTDSEYQAGLFEIFPELLKNTPVWPTMGNHDHYSDAYYGIFDLPTNGESGGVPSGTEAYYSFDYGNIHFVCLNSEEGPAGMVDWLVTDLQSTRADWIIAFFHHGPYTKGSHDSDREAKHFRVREDYLPVLEKYGVDLILSGHSHQYERSLLIDGHYQTSSTYLAREHAIDPGPGSSLGITDPRTGLFHYTNEYGPYQKTIATPNDGQVSATVGASSKLSLWRDTAGGDRYAVTHPNPHPVHVSTIRALGSLIIDIDGLTLEASYLDDQGRIRDHFEIIKTPEESPAIAWWQDRFGAGSYPRVPDWLADPDHDTHDNLAEFVHDGDPFVQDQLIEAVLKNGRDEQGENQQWFTVQYQLREGSQAAVEVSSNLVSFTGDGVETRRLSEPDARGMARWEARIERDGQRAAFFRIEISRVIPSPALGR